jgi:hypothetical protein
VHACTQGGKREIKKAVESYWADKSSADELQKVAKETRAANWATIKEAGVDFIPRCVPLLSLPWRYTSVCPAAMADLPMFLCPRYLSLPRDVSLAAHRPGLPLKFPTSAFSPPWGPLSPIK